MGRAEIVSAIGEGRYSVDYLYNTELIDFEIARLQLRKTQILEVDGPEAAADYSAKQAATSTAAEDLRVLLLELRGDVSPEVIDELTTANTSLDTAEDTLSTVGLRLASASVALTNSSNAFPPGPPPELIAAYNAAFTALTVASLRVGDEGDALEAPQTDTADALTEAQLETPNPDTVRSEIQAARDGFTALLAASSTAALAIASAVSAVQAAENELPGDPSYDTARTHAEAAIFALTNADDEIPPGLGAQPLHGLVAANYSEAQSSLEEAASLMTPGKAETKEEVKAAVRALHEASSAETIARYKVDSLNLELSQIEHRIDELEAVDRGKRVSLWCADYSTEIEPGTDVATIEVPGEYGSTGEVVIRPGFVPAALDWNHTRDGYLTPSQALTAAGLFYNWAMRPGWQVYKPTSRFARITAINEDQTVNVVLIAPNTSSDQSLNITPRKLPGEFETEEPASTTLESVSVTYMDCDTDAFVEGDEVVVEFQNQDQASPRVIGFRDNPRQCNLVKFYTPQEQLTPASTTWNRTEQTGQLYGNAYWTGAEGGLSWWGLSGRHISHPEDPSASEDLFHLGEQVGPAPGWVRGAAIHKHNAVKYLVVVTRERDSSHTAGSFDADDKFWIRRLDEVGGEWTLLHTQSYGAGAPDGVNVSALHFESVWFFNRSGDEAVCVKRQLGSRPAEYDDTFARMVGFSLSFDSEGVPQGTFIWHTVRIWDDTEENTFSDGCSGLDFLGIDCTVHNTFTGTTRAYDVYADFVGDTLTTLDTIDEGGSVYHVECGPFFECHDLSDIRAETVSKLDRDENTTRLVNASLGIDFVVSVFVHEVTTTWQQTENETDGEGNCAPRVEEAETDVTTLTGQALEWFDFHGGEGKVHFLRRDVNNIRTITSTQIRAYHIAGGVDVETDGTDVSSHTGSATLETEGLLIPVGEESASPWPFAGDSGIREALWAAADHRGNAIISSEQFDKKVGNPALPGAVLSTFEPVGIG